MNALRRWLPRFSLTTLLLSCVWLGVWLGLNLSARYAEGEQDKENYRNLLHYQRGWPAAVFSSHPLAQLHYMDAKPRWIEDADSLAVGLNTLCALFGVLLLHALVDRPRDHPAASIPQANAQRLRQRKFTAWSACLIAVWLLLAVLLNLHPMLADDAVRTFEPTGEVFSYGFPLSYVEQRGAGQWFQRLAHHHSPIRAGCLLINLGFTLSVAIILWLLIDRPFRYPPEKSNDSPPAR